MEVTPIGCSDVLFERHRVNKFKTSMPIAPAHSTAQSINFFLSWQKANSVEHWVEPSIDAWTVTIGDLFAIQVHGVDV
jgi:hypothetical protein